MRLRRILPDFLEDIAIVTKFNLRMGEQRRDPEPGSQDAPGHIGGLSADACAGSQPDPPRNDAGNASKQNRRNRQALHARAIDFIDAVRNFIGTISLARELGRRRRYLEDREQEEFRQSLA